MSKRNLRSKKKLDNISTEKNFIVANVKLENVSNLENGSNIETKKIKLTKTIKKKDEGLSKDNVIKNVDAPGLVLKLEYPFPERLKSRIFLGFHASVAGCKKIQTLHRIE